MYDAGDEDAALEVVGGASNVFFFSLLGAFVVFKCRRVSVVHLNMLCVCLCCLVPQFLGVSLGI